MESHVVFSAARWQAARRASCHLLIGALWPLLSSVAPARAQAYRDVISIGERPYIRSQQWLGGNAPNVISAYLCADAHGASMTFLNGVPPDLVLYLRQLDTWMMPLHSAVDVDPSRSYRATATCSRVDAYTGVVWTGNGIMHWFRVFDSCGAPRGATTDVFEIYGDDYWEVCGNSERWCVVQSGTRTLGGASRQIFLRAFDEYGVPLSDAVVVAQVENGYFRRVRCAMQDDDSVLLAYEHVLGPTGFRVFGQYISADLVADPPFDLAAPPVRNPYLKALADGTYLFAFGGFGTVPRFVQRLDNRGSPLSAAMEAGTAPGFLVAARDGRFAVVYSGEVCEPRVTLYDASWEPLGPPVEFAAAAAAQSCVQFDEVNGQDGYGGDGTLWLAWESDNVYRYVTSLKPIVPGDFNFDERANNFDIDPFVLALSDPRAYAIEFGLPEDVVPLVGDLNEDGAFNNFDIDAFVALLTTQ